MTDMPKPPPSEFEQLVESWFFETFQGSVVARTTEIWNAVHIAKDDLKKRIAELLATTHV